MPMWAMYKKSSAAQIKLILPVIKEDKFRTVEKAGAVFIEMAKGTGKEREYDWAKKLNFAISSNDLPLIYKAVQDSKKTGIFDLKLIHDPGAGSGDKGKVIKKLTIKNATNPGTYFFSIFISTDVNISISIHNGELYEFLKFIEDNQNTILGEGEYTPAAN